MRRRLPGWCGCVTAGLGFLCQPLSARAADGAAAAGGPERIWWEAERSSRTDLSADGPYSNKLTPEQAGVLSGGKWLNGVAAAGTQDFAEYDLDVKTGGKFEFFVRKFWAHGAMRWRFDDGAWVNVEEYQRLLDSVVVAPSLVASWQSLGYVTLGAGRHVLRVELLPDSKYRFAKNYAFDCFLLAEPGFVPEGLNPQGKDTSATIRIPEEAFGRFLPRTMALLQSATPQRRTKVKVLAYGQSIVANSQAASMLVEHLKKQFPDAVIQFKNTAIGGYQAPQLRKTCWQDLYPEYPDLVIFHDYGGEKTGEFEEMYRNLRAFTTAELLTWTHHIDNFGEGIDKQRDEQSEFLKQMAAKYRYEIADARLVWSEYLKQNHVVPQTLLVDQIHLNPKGSQLLFDTLLPHLRVHPQASQEWKKQVVDLPASAAASLPAGWTLENGSLRGTGGKPLTIRFTGNRLDASIQAEGGPAKLTFRLDGQRPSSFEHCFAASRSTIAPGSWWPAISYIGIGKQPVAQDYTLHFSEVKPDGTAYRFAVTGSVSGDEGGAAAGADFTARSGSFSLKAEDLALAGVFKTLKKTLPPDFDITFRLYSMSLDELALTPRALDHELARQTVVQCRDDAAHTLEILPASGTVRIDFFRAYSPSAAAQVRLAAGEAK